MTPYSSRACEKRMVFRMGTSSSVRVANRKQGQVFWSTESTADSSVLTPETNITPRAGRWVADSITWLRDTLGDFGAGELTVPKCGNRVNDNYEPFCSVDCTISHLMQNAQARAVLAPLMKAAQEKMAQLYGEEMTVGNESDSVGLGANMTLRSALSYGRVPQTMIDQLDEQLRRIPNL